MLYLWWFLIVLSVWATCHRDSIAGCPMSQGKGYKGPPLGILLGSNVYSLCFSIRMSRKIYLLLLFMTGFSGLELEFSNLLPQPFKCYDCKLCTVKASLALSFYFFYYYLY